MAKPGVAFRQAPKQVTFECGHIILFNAPVPRLGEHILCRTCRDYRRVTDTVTIYWLTCNRCQLTRYYGRDLDKPRTAASNHVIHRPSHVVQIYNGLVPVESIAQDEGQGMLPFAWRIEERLTTNRDHQRSLREAIANVRPLPNCDLTEVDIPPY